MISPTAFRDIVSGRRQSLVADLLRAVFHLASIPYGWVIRRRNARYDRGLEPVVRPRAPVISVGNLTVGGTGKTPMVEWIARHLRGRDVRVAILSRGYGAEQGGLNDEGLELELALPDVPHLQNPDRAAAASIAVEELGSQLLLLDDGFQHRRLARDLDVVLLDATEPFGHGYVLPRGTLREPVAGLRRANVVVLSRADMLAAGPRKEIRDRALALAPGAVWCEVEHRPAALINHSGAAVPIVELRGRRVAAFCGIGNPAGFRHTLASLGAEIVAWREFPDHHEYNRGDVDSLAAWIRNANPQLVLCTRKDLVKLRVATLAGAALHAVSIELAFLCGQAELEAAIHPLAQRAKTIEIDDAFEPQSH